MTWLADHWRAKSDTLGFTIMFPQTLDAVWLLLCSGLVFLMQPGFMCLESGLTRSKSSIDVAIKNLVDFGLSIALFWAVGYALMFGDSAGGWFGWGRAMPSLESLGAWPAAFFVFQAMFCGTAVTIVSGAAAERLRFRAYLLITLLASGPIYTVFGHWAWNGLDAGDFFGWLGALGFRDFAGATVVHGAGGWLALAVVLAVGPRQGRFPSRGPAREIQGHNLPLAILGAFLLWLGWFGFNGGSVLIWTDRVPAIVGNTMLAGAGGLVTGLLAGERLRGRPDVRLAMNGALAGLVSITGSCHAVGSAAAIVIGGAGGLVMVAATWLLERRHVDDAVGAVPVHAAAGVWGTLAVALFADPRVLDSGLGRLEQLGVQALGAGVCFLWAFGGGYLILAGLRRVVDLRVGPEEEIHGLNVVEHGATTELLELVTAMEKQAESGGVPAAGAPAAGAPAASLEADLSLRFDADPGTEAGLIAAQYNRVVVALQRAVQDVRAGAERYRRTIENALDAIVTVDEHGVILGWNPRAEAIFGWSREEAFGQDVFELITPREDREDTRSGLLSFLSGGQSTLLGRRIEVTGVDRDGGKHPIEATFTMSAAGARPEFNLFLEDITDRQRQRRALLEAKESAEAATRAKSEFLANMSHEIRTPMNGILGIVELMLDAGPGPRQRRYLEMIRVSADSLLRLLGDVLDFSKFEAGKIEVQTVDFDLRENLVGVLGALAVQAREKGLRLACRVAPEIPDPLVGDPVRLGQVLTNLVSNAIKFTAEGEVIVEIGLASSQPPGASPPVASRRRVAVLELSVSDTGPGIPPELHERIFHAFQQADDSIGKRYGGTGLGLAICKRLVASMGGEITVEGGPGAGSTFRFSCRFGLRDRKPPAGEASPRDQPLPVTGKDASAGEVPRRELPLLFEDEDEPAAAAAPRRPEAGGEVPEPGAGGRALVVEDNRINQVVAEGMLESWGIETEIASSGIEALAALDRRQHFDLVLMDMRMPDMSGFDVTAAIRAAEPVGEPAGGTPVRRLPIIAMTANVSPGDRRNCLDAGMDGYVAKPIAKSALLEALRAAGVVGDAAPAPSLAVAPQERPREEAVLDRETLLKRVGGRRERAHKLAAIFLEEDGPHHLASLRRGVAERDAPAVGDAAHALRGAAGEICAWAVSGAAERLEAAVDSSEFQQIERKYETLAAEVKKLYGTLEAWIETRA